VMEAHRSSRLLDGVRILGGVVKNLGGPAADGGFDRPRVCGSPSPQAAIIDPRCCYSWRAEDRPRSCEARSPGNPRFEI
jgi:hypothetical protein